MRRYILLGILYLIGLLFIVDILNNGFFVEELLFEVMEWEYLIFIILAYFLGSLMLIIGLNSYLMLKEDNLNLIHKWIKILFMPLFSLIFLEMAFSIFGIIDMPQSDVGVIVKGLLTLLSVAFGVIGYGVFRETTMKQKEYVKATYIILHCMLMVVLILGVV